MILRREFTAGLGAVSIAPVARAHAQTQGKQFRIGFLASSPPSSVPQFLGADPPGYPRHDATGRVGHPENPGQALNLPLQVVDVHGR